MKYTQIPDGVFMFYPNKIKQLSTSYSPSHMAKGGNEKGTNFIMHFLKGDILDIMEMADSSVAVVAYG